MRELVKRLTPKPLIILYQKLRYEWIVMLFYLFRLFPIQNNRIVLCNVWGFGDNAKYVTEELVRQRLPYELIFITNHPPKGISGIRFLKTNSVKAIKALATARVWVDSNRKEAFTRKRAGQYYIQLWHGGLPLKKIEGDCAEYLGEKYIKRAKKDSNITDLYVSNGAFCTQMYRRAFWYRGEILECGTPRNDILLSENQGKISATKRKLGINTEKKIVLYAPTYRDTTNPYTYEINYEAIQNELKKKYEGEWVVVIRLHPLVAQQSSHLLYNELFIDGSRYPDMYELMKASDVLITDYSNTMFEFAMMKRPVFLYAKDANSYSNERGFYFNMEELPFQMATSTEELLHNIRTHNQDSYEKETQEFFNLIKLKETGTASKQVVEKIVEVIK